MIVKPQDLTLKTWIVSLGAHAEEKLGKTRVRFIPFYELL